MSGALFYLWLTLLKRRAWCGLRALRRPTSLLGFLAVIFVIGFLFHFRRHELMAHLVEPRVLTGGAGLMLCGALFKGFLQRGLVFEPADVDFLFTSPLSQRQIIAYRLLSDYAFAVIQSLIFLALLGSHFEHPWLAGVCLLLFQIACFHLATASAILGGAIAADLHHRLRWMLLGFFFFLAAFYLHVAWQLKVVPSAFSRPELSLLFYPAVSLPELANAPGLHCWVSLLVPNGQGLVGRMWPILLFLAGFLGGALGSLWLLFRFKSNMNLFEASLATSTHRAEKRVRLQHGRVALEAQQGTWRSGQLPQGRLFQGVRAILWKNLVVARRSKRELLWVSAFAFLYTGFTMALLYLYEYYSKQAGVSPPHDEASSFYLGVALFLAGLTFFLQRMVPFDFRRDGQHLLGFRTLPYSAFGLALAQVGVPTLFCLALQAPCIVALLGYAHFPALTLLLIVLSYPAVALALNSVWNLHYLLAAAKRAAGQDVTAVGTLLIVALSFLVFYPAGWIMLWLAQHLPHNSGIPLPLGAGLAVQYLVDALIVVLLARTFQRIEVGRQA